VPQKTANTFVSAVLVIIVPKRTFDCYVFYNLKFVFWIIGSLLLY